ncbi:MAG TPA: alkaline phosphatase D family protein [Myxococcaceae bacterium]|nr:alkaline phosphatase D family protein [Myxococcaceae bacterium]
MANVPPQFARNFYFDVDQWDGFPHKRAELLAQLSTVQNLIALSGDIHWSRSSPSSCRGAPEER